MAIHGRVDFQSEDDNLQDQRQKNLLALQAQQLDEVQLKGRNARAVAHSNGVELAVRDGQPPHVRRFETADFSDSLVARGDSGLQAK